MGRQGDKEILDAVREVIPDAQELADIAVKELGDEFQDFAALLEERGYLENETTETAVLDHLRQAYEAIKADIVEWHAE